MTTSSNRLRIAVLFGGRSAEHDVSVLSATNVMRVLEPAKYDAVPVFITRDGRWLLSGFEDGAPDRHRGLPCAGRTRTDDGNPSQWRAL